MLISKTYIDLNFLWWRMVLIEKDDMELSILSSLGLDSLKF
jgi:hypothetical protein